MGNAVSELRRGGRTIEGHPASETPGAEASGESEVPRDPLWEASDEVGTWADLLLRLAKAQQGEIWPMSLLLSIFSLKGRDRALD
jgi:hypothetical protein